MEAKRPTRRSHDWLANRLKYQGFRVAAFLATHLPEPLAYGAAGPVGTIAATLTPHRRAAVVDNLSHVLGTDATPKRLERLSRAVYRNIVRYYVDLLRSPAVDVARLQRERVRGHGLNHLTNAIADGRGVILATMHFGCPEVALQAARAWGLRFFVLTELVEPPELSRLFERARSSHGHEFMPVGLSAIKQAVRTLRRGGSVLLVVDRDIQRSGVLVPFFGQPARMPTGAVELARLTGAPILVAVSRRLPGGTAEVTVEPRIDLIETGSRETDLRSNLRLLVSRFEPYVHRDPDQWMVLERLWPPTTAAHSNE